MVVIGGVTSIAGALAATVFLQVRPVPAPAAAAGRHRGRRCWSCCCSSPAAWPRPAPALAGPVVRPLARRRGIDLGRRSPAAGSDTRAAVARERRSARRRCPPGAPTGPPSGPALSPLHRTCRASYGSLPGAVRRRPRRAARARSSPCSAPTAPGSPRCCGRCPACSRPPAAPSPSTARDITGASAGDDGRPGLSPSCPAGAASSRPSPSPRTSAWPAGRSAQRRAAVGRAGTRARPVPAAGAAASTTGPATCPAASSRCCRWPWPWPSSPELLCIDELVARPGPDRGGPARRRGPRPQPRRHDRRGRRAVGRRRPAAGRAGRVPGEGPGPLLRRHRRAARPPRPPPRRLPRRRRRTRSGPRRERRPAATGPRRTRRERPARRPCEAPGARPSASAASTVVDGVDLDVAAGRDRRPHRRTTAPARRRCFDLLVGLRSPPDAGHASASAALDVTALSASARAAGRARPVLPGRPPVPGA